MAQQQAHGQSPEPTEGAALPWILEHLLAYPGNYEIPLRTMYSLNSNSISQPPSFGSNTSPTSSFSREAPGNAFPATATDSTNNNVTDTAALFKAQLMSQIAQLPSQPSSLPPSFITSFVRRCFPPVVEEVDFPQALTALDYLKDLENRRRKEMIAALNRLGITGAEGEKEELARRFPGVLAWIDSMESKERTAMALYSQVYIRLRHWTLINEMLLEPFNKANCIAMLNTLFPPVTATPPTIHLSARKLQDQRMLFFNYIRDVEDKGKHVLDYMITKDIREGERTGWPVAREYIENYLRAANAIIEECSEVNGRQAFEETTSATSERQHSKSRKVDSGISFMSVDRPSTSSSIGSAHKSNNKPFPQSPPLKPKQTGGSTLERIARELRKMKSRADIGDAAKEEKQRPRSLRKMKSTQGLRDREKRESGDSIPPFDPEEFKRHRQEWEAKNAAKLDNYRRTSG